MENFIKIIGGVLIAVFLGLALNRQGKDISLLLSIGVCCMVLTAAMAFLEPVLEFALTLRDTCGLDSGMLKILLKAVGVGLVAEITGLICADSGNGALGKAVQILATVLILWLSIPLMTQFLELVQTILGEV